MKIIEVENIFSFFNESIEWRKRQRKLCNLSWDFFENSEKQTLINGCNHVLEQGGELKFILIKNDDKLLGSCIIGTYPGLIIQEEQCGFWACPEFADHAEIIPLVLHYSTNYFIPKGIKKIVAPFDFGIWFKYRFQSTGYDLAAFVGEPRNPAYYPRLFENAGFDSAFSWNNYAMPRMYAQEIVKNLQEQIHTFYALGYKQVFIHKKNASELTKKAYHIFSQAYKVFPGFTEISETIFLKEYNGFHQLLNKKASFFVENPDGELVACVFVMRDLFLALKSMHGNWNLWSKIKFYFLQNQGNRAFVYQGAALPSAVRKAAVLSRNYTGNPLSLGQAGFALSLKAILENPKIQTIEMALTRPDAPNVNYIKNGAEMNRTYHLYIKNL